MNEELKKWASTIPVTALINRSRELVTVDANAPFFEVLEKLNTLGVHSLPVTAAGSHTPIGVIDVLDIAVEIYQVAQLAHFAPDFKPGDVAAAFIDTKKLRNELQHITAAQLLNKAAVPTLERLVDKPTEMCYHESPRHVSSTDSLLLLLDKLGAEARHRVPVVDANTGKILEMVTQSDVCRYLVSQLEVLPKKLRERPVGSIATYGLHYVGHHASMAAVLHTFETRKTTCVPINNKSGSFLNAIGSTEFIKSLSDLGNLGLAVDEFLALTKPQPAVVNGDATVEEVLRQVAEQKLYRVWVPLDGSVGLVTLRDLIRSFTLPEDRTSLGHAIPT